MTRSPFHKTILLFLVAMSAAAQAQCDDYPFIHQQNKRFKAIDLLVTLIEKYDGVKLTSEMGSPLPASASKQAIRLTIWQFLASHKIEFDSANTNVPDIGKFVDKVIDIMSADLSGGCDATTKRAFLELHHHTKKLFHNTSINDGRDFDENLLAIYHLFRNQINALEETARLRSQMIRQEDRLIVISDSLECLRYKNNLMHAQLNNKINTVSSILEKKIAASSDSSRRSEIIQGLFYGRKNRYRGNKLRPEEVNKIYKDSKTMKEARKKIKKNF